MVLHSFKTTNNLLNFLTESSHAWLESQTEIGEDRKEENNDL